MTRRERLMATLRGEGVDRPPVCFYELNGLDENPDDRDPFNIYSHPSWRSLIELTRAHTDRIVMRNVRYRDAAADPIDVFADTETRMENGSRFTTRRIRAGKRILTTRTRRDPDVNTIWTEEHLLKDTDDLDAFLEVPFGWGQGCVPDGDRVVAAEEALGDSGIVMIDTPDPLCIAASLFDMETYMIIAMTDPDRFHRILEHVAGPLLRKTADVAAALPGRLWRICGPEYATAPYLPPDLFREYVCRYDRPMVEAIQRCGGYARIHSHGNLSGILDDIVAMGADGLDPIEPPPQGDMHLAEVRERCGGSMVLFGNLEVSDIENLPSPAFAERVKRALDEGPGGRGFVLMPSACPYGRVVSERTRQNYETMVRMAT